MAAERLASAGIPDARREARLLLGHALGVEQVTLLRDRALLVDDDLFAELVSRRLAHEPMALITGRVGFWTLSLVTSSATLVPRADSETVVAAALAEYPNRDVGWVLDLGTGTGCLLLAVLAECPAAFGVGVDLVPQAAQLAAHNARENGLSDRSGFVCGDWASAFSGRFDLILCNPPYIPSPDIPHLMPEVACYEPDTALNGGEDGLDAYRMVIEAMASLLAPDGVAVLELGIGQADAVAKLSEAAGLFSDAPWLDLGGIARAIVLRRTEGLGTATKKPFGAGTRGG